MSSKNKKKLTELQRITREIRRQGGVELRKGQTPRSVKHRKTGTAVR